jgi:threonine dehydrogenase-like Zn-dependent dehydrogenase
MRALVFTAPGVVELLDVAEPAPTAGETVVSVAASGICGSDLHGTRRAGFRQPPLVLGHEFVGTLLGGERVVVNPLLSCGSCSRCAEDEPQLCATRQLIGVHRSGGLAERVAVPTECLHELPDHLPWTTAALIEPIANAIHVERLADGFANKRVAVLGCGTIGMTTVQLARRAGASFVAATDFSTFRRAAAGRSGADEVGARLDGEYDVVVDAVGASATRRDSVAHLRPGGTAVWVGLLDDDAGFAALDLVRSGKTVHGSFAYGPQDFARAVGLADGWDATWVDTVPLAEGAEIFEELARGKEHPVKVVLVP